MPPTLPPVLWGPPWAVSRPRSVVELIGDGVLDAELAALLWLLVEARLPLVVAAGPSGVGKSTLLAALLSFLPADADVRAVLGPEPDLSWLPEASTLGWTRTEVRSGPDDRLADASRTVLLAPELSAHAPWYPWGRLARVLVRATSLGYGLATTVHGERLEDVLQTLSAPPVSLTSDELGHLGVVVILRAFPRSTARSRIRRRVVAAHLLRPPFRDAEGHVQRLGPAVLAALDPSADRLDHYAWGVMTEIGLRLGRRGADLERAQARRGAFLGELVARGAQEPAQVDDAIDAYRSEHARDPTA